MSHHDQQSADELADLDECLAELDMADKAPAEQLHPFERAAIVERTIASFCGVAQPERQGKVVRPRRWWPAIPAVAAAAAGLLLILRPGGDTAERARAIDALVSVGSATRDASETGAGPLRIASTQRFQLECRARDEPEATVESVRATARGAAGASVRHLGFDVIAGTDGRRLHVHAGLPVGEWEVTCGVLDGAGRFGVLGPPALVVVGED